MSLKRKRLSYLRINVTSLPGMICDFDRKGRTGDADRCRSMLRECTAELKRRNLPMSVGGSK